jgi:hypothetical protein
MHLRNPEILECSLGDVACTHFLKFHEEYAGKVVFATRHV